MKAKLRLQNMKMIRGICIGKLIRVISCFGNFENLNWLPNRVVDLYLYLFSVIALRQANKLWFYIDVIPLRKSGDVEVHHTMAFM